MGIKTNTSTQEESAIIERVARIVSSVRGAKPDYALLAAELEQAVPFDIFGVVLLRHDRQAVRVSVCEREEGHKWKAQRHQHPFEDSKLEQVLQSEIQIRDYPDGLDGPPSTSGYALSGYHQLHSTLIAPLVVEDRVLGMLELGSVHIHMYADAHLQRLIRAVVRVLATAIESVQLGGNAAIQDRQRQALKDVTSALTSKKELSSILSQIVEGIAQSLKVASCVVLLDRREGYLHIVAQAGLEQEIIAQVDQHRMRMSEKSIVGQSIMRQLPLATHDIAHDERFPEQQQLFAQLGIHSVYSYPLVTGTTVYGALLLCSEESGGFTPLKVDILALFANQATVAIHNNLLLESVHQRSHFQQTIAQLEQAQQQRMAASLQPESMQDELALLAHVRAESQKTLGVSFSSLLHFISDHLLTRPEQTLRAVFAVEQGQDVLVLPEEYATGQGQLAEMLGQEQVEGRNGLFEEEASSPFAETLAFLAQTAEEALTRAGMLGELSRLLVQLKQSTNGVKDPWFVVDLDGYCTYINPAAELFCGQRLETMASAYSRQGTARKITDVFGKLQPKMRNLPEVESYLQEFTQGYSYRQEMRCTLAAEAIRSPLDEMGSSASVDESVSRDYYYHFTRYPLYSQSKQLEASALQVHDVTEQVRDEQNRSALLSSVSHDLRTPLTTIKAAVTGLLQHDVEWDEQDRQAMLEDINCEADHLTVLVNALVELSRLEMGALILEKEWSDIAEIVHGAMTKARRIVAGRSITTRWSEKLPLIYVDYAQVGRVCYNLLENAVQHSPQGSEIGIEINMIGEDPEWVRVKVSDKGQEIPEQERERIFTSFYSARSYGNGMSLAISKGIISAHQGEIWVEAATGGGSSFIFTLPAHSHVLKTQGGVPRSS